MTKFDLLDTVFLSLICFGLLVSAVSFEASFGSAMRQITASFTKSIGQVSTSSYYWVAGSDFSTAPASATVVQDLDANGSYRLTSLSETSSVCDWYFVFKAGQPNDSDAKYTTAQVTSGVNVTNDLNVFLSFKPKTTSGAVCRIVFDANVV